MKGTWLTGFATIAIALLRDGLRQLARVADLRITGPMIRRVGLGVILGMLGGAVLKVWLNVQILGIRPLRIQTLGFRPKIGPILNPLGTQRVRLGHHDWLGLHTSFCLG